MQGVTDSPACAHSLTPLILRVLEIELFIGFGRGLYKRCSEIYL